MFELCFHNGSNREKDRTEASFGMMDGWMDGWLMVLPEKLPPSRRASCSERDEFRCAEFKALVEELIGDDSGLWNMLE